MGAVVRATSRRRTRRERSRTRRALFLALFVGATLIGYTFVRITVQDHAIVREAAAARAEIGLLELQQAALRAQIGVRQSDEYVEQKARELGYVRPGEGLVTVGQPPAASVGDKAQTTPKSRFTRWLALFFAP